MIRRCLTVVLLLSIAVGQTVAAGDGPTPVFFESLSVDRARIVAADSEPHNWLTHGRNYAETRFSPLAAINRETIGRLGLAWAAPTGTRRGLEATPLVVNGIMYTTGSWSRVYALNAATGEPIWTFDPKVPGAVGRKACCDVVNRGLALWGGKVFVGALDGRLIALDARDGTVVWSTTTVPPDRSYTITGAPRVVNGKVIIGNGGAEFGVRGYFSAYDAATGELAWRFYTVPGDPALPLEHPELKQALDTWSPDSLWETGLGGTVWDSFAYDAELNQLYVGVGNSSQYNRAKRSPGGGDNLFLSSILAINPDTGRLLWHYQTTPAEHWDYTATQHMILAELKGPDGPRKVLMQAPKNGFFYVLDRTNGELVSAEKYTAVNWASHVDMETGRPVETGKATWTEEQKFVMPGPTGGHNWHPMSYSERTGLVYIPTLESVFPFTPKQDYEYVPNVWNTGEDWPAMTRGAGGMGRVSFCSPTQLTAWDPVRQEQVWQVPHQTASNGGVLSTGGGLVFQGNGSAVFRAYADDDGAILWETDVPTGIIAPPMTYSVGGEQYVAVMVGNGGIFGMLFDELPFENDGYVLAFKLGGTAVMPPRKPRNETGRLRVEAQDDVPEPVLARGSDLYAVHCLRCHGPGGEGTGFIKDLRHSSREVHAIWPAIVLGGAYQDRGMAGFGDVLDGEDVEAIHAYVLDQAAFSESFLGRAARAVTGAICIPPAWLAE